MKDRQRMLGFSLTELMITVAIAAILASIAYPSYTAYVRRANRTEARTALLQVQVAQEKFFLQYNRYAGGNSCAASVTELNNLPSNTTTPGLGIGSTTPSGNYQICLNRPTATSYTVSAIPQAGQTSDSCGTLSIDQLGSKLPTTANCWK